MVVRVSVVVVSMVDTVVWAGVSVTVDCVAEDTVVLDEDVEAGIVVPSDALEDVLADALPVTLADVRLLLSDAGRVSLRTGKEVLPPSIVVSVQFGSNVVVVVVESLGVITTPPE